MGWGVPSELNGADSFVGWLTYEGQPVFIAVKELLTIPDRDWKRTPILPNPKPRLKVTPLLSKSEYLDRIAQCLEWIRAGETYEICLTNQIQIDTGLKALDYYERLRALNPAPRSAFLSFGNTQVACASPESFLHIDRDRRVHSRPIKGTLPLSRNPQDLLTQERFRAENLMIVDLVRNDLSRVCEVGSVQVPQLMAVETYATVHQLVSTIAGKLRPDVTDLDCIRAAFPGGSMTGAPKIRTMELLRRLEPRPRGIYSGCLGFINFAGVTDLNIVIRTAVFDSTGVSIGTGGAIVAQSDPEEEWAETELKAAALLAAF